jgi:iron complex outermembrane receptor protein
VGGRFADFANTFRVGSYGLIGARASFSTDRWQVYAEGRNLMDKRYIAALVVKDQASSDQELLHPGAPRAVYLGANYRF